MRSVETSPPEIITVPKPAFFITTASGKAGKESMALKAGYEILPPHLKFIAEEASRREDLFADAYDFGVVHRHYNHNSEVPNTANAAANKAQAVDDCYLALQQSTGAVDLTGRGYVVMDNQEVMVDPVGNKIAFKKFRTDTPSHQVEDIRTLVDTMKIGAEKGSHVEYLSTFVEGVFGHPTKKIYKTVRVIVGKVLPELNTQLMAAIIANNNHVTGGIDIEELITHFVDCSEAKVLVRTYKEVDRRHIHYGENEIVLIDKLQKLGEHSFNLSKDYLDSLNVLPLLVRGFAAPTSQPLLRNC